MVLAGCGSGAKDPEIFLPRVLSPEGADLDELRSRYCQGIKVDLQDDFLTHENFRAIFDCANYDSSLNGLKPLFTSSQFPLFLKNLNLVLKSDSTANLKETLRPWLEEGPEGTSRVDRLLPALAKIIKNPSFQTGLPVLHNILESGRSVWRDLLPGLSALLYQERFPDTYQDLAVLFADDGKARDTPVDYSGPVKSWAKFLKSDVDGKTVAARALELADRVKEVSVPGSSIQEYLDHMNEKGVFVSLYLESGAVRGETIDPKLNADPDEEELRDGLSLSPQERQERAYRKLFARGPNGEGAPIVQLAGLVEEFHRDHPEFLPALARWFSANGEKVTEGLTEYVVRARVVSNLARLSAEGFLTTYAKEKGNSLQQKVTGDEFVAFLGEAFASASFTPWLETELLALNKEQFGPKNGEIMKASRLALRVSELYTLPAVAAFGKTLVPEGKTLALGAALKRFSNLHRGEKLEIDFGGVKQNLEKHLVDAWWVSANETLGESVVLGFAVELAQTLFTQMATDFSAKGITLTEWYYSSPYSNPATTEAVAGYAFKELGLLDRYYQHKEELKGSFAEEVFANEDDRRAFRLLVDQVPHIWLYIKSGMSRSGNDLTRALASKDKGYLIRNYVNLLVSAQASGMIRDGVRLIEAYHQNFAPSKAAEVSDGLEERREVSKGADAMKRVMRSLFEPDRKGDYATSTLGRVLEPVSALVAPARRAETERFLLTSADEILRTPDADINSFLNDLMKEESEDSVLSRRDALKAAAELLRDPIFPDLVRELATFFEEDAVQPALQFLAEKIDNGSLQDTLLFIRRLLGFRA
jgi:hypothetical protein